MNEQEMEARLTRVEERSKSNTHRLDDVEKKVDTLQRLTTAVEVMATEQRHQTETMAEIKEDVTALGTKVDAIEKKPGEKWDGMVDKFLYGLVGALAAALAGGLFHLLTVAV